MNEEIKTKWIAALRSGKYKQGEGCLRNGNSFCCLGVLCDIKNPNGWENNSFNDGGEEAVKVLPEAVRNWAGLPATNGSNLNGICLAELNDEGYSFEHIANVIEYHF